jgi:hypothetical protein
MFMIVFQIHAQTFTKYQRVDARTWFMINCHLASHRCPEPQYMILFLILLMRELSTSYTSSDNTNVVPRNLDKPPSCDHCHCNLSSYVSLVLTMLCKYNAYLLQLILSLEVELDLMSSLTRFLRSSHSSSFVKEVSSAYCAMTCRLAWFGMITPWHSCYEIACSTIWLSTSPMIRKGKVPMGILA